MVYETKFVNRRDSVTRIFEHGRELVRLEPGETRHVESRSARTSYSRWSRVTFSGNDKVSFDENSDWEWPWPGMLRLEFLNVDGASTEALQVGGQFWQSSKGIPRLIPINFRDTTWCFVERVERRLVTHRVREGDYIVKKKVLEDVRTERSRKEIKKIQDRLLDEAIEKTRQELLKQFPKVEEGEE